MTLPTSGPLSLQDIAGEFGGSAPHSLSEYYAGGGLVQAGASGVNGPVPSSGPLSLSQFLGTSAFTLAFGPASTVDSISVTGTGTVVFQRNLFNDGSLDAGRPNTYWTQPVSPALVSGLYRMRVRGSVSGQFAQISVQAEGVTLVSAIPSTPDPIPFTSDYALLSSGNVLFQLIIQTAQTLGGPVQSVASGFFDVQRVSDNALVASLPFNYLLNSNP